MTATLSPLRVGRVTGSRIAAVLGIDPYTTRDERLREMVRQALGAEPEFTGNIATAWGNAHELDGIAEWERHRGMFAGKVGDAQETVVHPEFEGLAVTPDGVADNRAIEVKCPYWGSYTTWRDVPWYEAQCRLVMECLDLDRCDFVVWRPGGTVVSELDRDPDWLAGNLPTIADFLTEFATICDDDDLAAPYLRPLVDVRTDAEWSEAAQRYLEALATQKIAESRASDARIALLGLTDEPARGFGVSVSRSERKGSIEYARAVADLAPEADLEAYRKQGSTVWTVRVAS